MTTVTAAAPVTHLQWCWRQLYAAAPQPPPHLQWCLRQLNSNSSHRHPLQRKLSAAICSSACDDHRNCGSACDAPTVVLEAAICSSTLCIRNTALHCQAPSPLVYMRVESHATSHAAAPSPIAGAYSSAPGNNRDMTQPRRTRKPGDRAVQWCTVGR
jgi:hypothetical protein